MTNILAPNRSKKVPIKIKDKLFLGISTFAWSKIIPNITFTDQKRSRSSSRTRPSPRRSTSAASLSPALAQTFPVLMSIATLSCQGASIKHTLSGRKWNIQRFKKIFHHDASSRQVFDDAASVLNGVGDPSQPRYSILNLVGYDQMIRATLNILIN